MAKVFDVILLTVFGALLAGSSVYKLFLWFRYGDDPAKREALVSAGQVYPKRLARWLLDEDADVKTTKASLPNPGRK